MKQYRMTAQSLLQLWSADIKYEIFAASRFMGVTRVTEEQDQFPLACPLKRIRIEVSEGALTRYPDTMIEVRQKEKG